MPDAPPWRTARLRHITVEVGLDAWWLRRNAPVARTRLRDALDAEGARMLAGAYHDTYGIDIDPDGVRQSHRCVTFWYNTCLRLAAWLGEEQQRNAAARLAGRRKARHPVAALRSAVTPFLPPHVAANGFLNAQPPTRGFVGRTRAGILRHDLWLDRHLASRLRNLPDYDLETGERLDGFVAQFFSA